MINRVPLIFVALLTSVLWGCDTETDQTGCSDPPTTASAGTFALRIQEADGCFVIQGGSSRFGVRDPSYSDSSTVYALLVPDDDDEPTETTTFVQFLAVGDGPLPVGTYDVADLYMRSPVQYAPPAGSVRLLEYPGRIALQAVIGRDENAYSRGGTLTVTRSGPEGFAGRIDAQVAVKQTVDGVDRPGAVLRVQGAFDVKPGADGFIVLL